MLRSLQSRAESCARTSHYYYSPSLPRSHNTVPIPTPSLHAFSLPPLHLRRSCLHPTCCSVPVSSPQVSKISTNFDQLNKYRKLLLFKWYLQSAIINIRLCNLSVVLGCLGCTVGMYGIICNATLRYVRITLPTV